MKKATVAILAAAVIFSAVLMFLYPAANVLHGDWVIGASCRKAEGTVGYYAPRQLGRTVPFPSDELEILFHVWDSAKKEPGGLKNTIDVIVFDRTGDSGIAFYYDSAEGILYRLVRTERFFFDFRKKPFFRLDSDVSASYAVLSGAERDRIDTVFDKYIRSAPVKSSVIVERTGLDRDGSVRSEGCVDLSRTVFTPDHDGNVPNIPQAALDYLKKSRNWSAIDEIRTVPDGDNGLETGEYSVGTVYRMTVRTRWDEIHDRLFVLEYDEQNDRLYSSEYEDIDPGNGRKDSPFYDEIYICPGLRKEAEAVFPEWAGWVRLPTPGLRRRRPTRSRRSMAWTMLSGRRCWS